MESKRAVIYCRVSTKEQVEEGNSLSTQERICRDYALKNGYEIAEVFIEQGESAKTADRTELQRLLNFCAIRKNNVGAVIAYKLDRISRNTDDYSQIRLLLKRYSVEIKSTSEYFENTPAGRFMENIIANVAQFDNDVRTERSIGGMRDAVREGRYVWMAPLGYSNIKIGGKCTIAPNELAPLIRRAFEEVNTGLFSIEEIRRKMTNEGLLTRSGKPIYTSHFHTILRNELYAGWIVKFGERHKGTFEPIVSDALFESVQHILKKRKRRMGKYLWENPDFPLRRFVQHKDGSLLTGSWAKGRLKYYPYYRFAHKPYSFRKSFVEESFKAFLNSFTLSKQYFEEFKGLLKQHLIKKSENISKQSLRIEKTITDLKERQKILIQKNLKGFISDSILQQQLELIEVEIRELEMQLQSCPVKTYDYSKLIDTAAQILVNPGEIWLNASFVQKIQLQCFQFPLGVTFDGKKFGTAKMCKLFKLKTEFSTRKFTEVSSKGIPWNRPNVPEPLNNATTWSDIGDELIRAEEILAMSEVQQE